jgi:hypothetical protein
MELRISKEELISTRRIGDNVNYKYDLPPDKKNKMHDDRAYTMVMLAWHLKNLKREGIVNKKVTTTDWSKAPTFVSSVSFNSI